MVYHVAVACSEYTNVCQCTFSIALRIRIIIGMKLIHVYINYRWSIRFAATQVATKVMLGGCRLSVNGFFMWDRYLDRARMIARGFLWRLIAWANFVTTSNEFSTLAGEDNSKFIAKIVFKINESRIGINVFGA